jgi:hypothetical protein
MVVWLYVSGRALPSFAYKGSDLFHIYKVKPLFLLARTPSFSPPSSCAGT